MIYKGLRTHQSETYVSVIFELPFVLEKKRVSSGEKNVYTRDKRRNIRLNKVLRMTNTCLDTFSMRKRCIRKQKIPIFLSKYRLSHDDS